MWNPHKTIYTYTCGKDIAINRSKPLERRLNNIISSFFIKFQNVFWEPGSDLAMVVNIFLCNANWYSVTFGTVTCLVPLVADNWIVFLYPVARREVSCFIKKPLISLTASPSSSSRYFLSAPNLRGIHKKPLHRRLAISELQNVVVN